MRQVLFTVPIFKGMFPPDGIPVYGFGAMLFVTFIVVTWWGTVRAKKIGMEASRFQDFTIWVFISGIIGARVLYMIQYAHQFPNESIGAILSAFFKIWEGGIVFYGSALGGAIGYGLFYWLVMRRLQVSGWQLADAVAPLLALGLAIGRIGCYLNGCCWGQVANEEVCAVPLGTAHFPLLPAHARPQLVNEKLLQTSTGFAVAARDGGDPRPRITAVEVGSPAETAGVRVGDRITKVNDESTLVANVSGPPESVKAALDILTEKGGKIVPRPGGETTVAFDDLPSYLLARSAVRNPPEALGSARDAVVTSADRLEEITSTNQWPRGKSELRLSVERPKRDKDGTPNKNGETEVLSLPPFSPTTIGLYPTQLYETLSMVLLMLFLLAYYPFRRHDGQLMVILMLGYALHRFVNESLRIEPSYGGGMTLSQWASVIVVALAVAMEVYLWRVMPSRWRGEAQYVAPPVGGQPTAPTAPASHAPTAPPTGGKQ
jgi:phosphatidylglycerol:prolipoprotein diacylglycerol transferase